MSVPLTGSLGRGTTMVMDPVRRQYEAYPYPARDPADEARRLIEGSPSHPVEIDHYVFGGRRDWSQPFRALVAGGGTGDGLIMLAQKLADIGCPADITYIDMSEASREIAEARARARGLDVRFITGDLLAAADMGPFDYIDCCGVLHHLPDPDAGFQALSAALASDGGIGLMVYAPYGRSGVYPLQAAFGTLLATDAPEEKVRLARAALGALPPSHPFSLNPVLGDHEASDAGLYDLLIHARDRAYTVAELGAALDGAGLGLVSVLGRTRYDPLRYLPDCAALAKRVKQLDPIARLAVGEQLSGNLKTHIAYAVKAGRADKAEARPTKPDLVPHLAGVPAQGLARHIHKHGAFSAKEDGLTIDVAVPRASAPLIAQIDGQRTLGQIAAGQDWLSFSAAWGPVHRALTGINVLHYSMGVKR
ncbi:MAG: class I SAM-dependent methyltransferase [Pseudomonadota bacterium]